MDTAAAQLLALGVTVFEVLPANYVRAPKVYRRGRPAALKGVGQAPAPGQSRQAQAGKDHGWRSGGGDRREVLPATGRS